MNSENLFELLFRDSFGEHRHCLNFMTEIVRRPEWQRYGECLHLGKKRSSRVFSCSFSELWKFPSHNLKLLRLPPKKSKCDQRKRFSD